MKKSSFENGPNHELTDRQLIARADATARREHDEGNRLLQILVELDRRSICLGLGYSSLFDFCTRRWLFSRAKAGRYIAVARATCAFPQLRTMLETRKLTIGNAALLVGVLTDANSEDVLRRAAGRTYKEIEEIAAEHREARPVREMVRPIGRTKVCRMEDRPAELFRDNAEPPSPRCSGLEAHEAGAAASSHGGLHQEVGCESACRSEAESGTDTDTDTDTELDTKAESGVESGAEFRPASGSAEPPAESQTETRYEIRFAANQAFADKLERVRAIRSGSGRIEDLFEHLLDEYLQRNDPSLRRARRARRSQGRGASNPHEQAGANGPAVSNEVGARTTARPAAPAAAQTSAQTTAQPAAQPAAHATVQTAAHTKQPRGRRSLRRSRHIPVAVRDEVFERDRGACTYVGPDGVRCSSSRDLQVDHVVPFSLGGGHDIENLRLLCGRHNRLEARRLLDPWGRCAGAVGTGSSREQDERRSPMESQC